LICYLLVFRPKWRRRFVFIFAVGELLNGCYHLVWTILAGRYFPGAVSGIFFIPLSIYLIKNYNVFQKEKDA
jgi:hypothetical protein